MLAAKNNHQSIDVIQVHDITEVDKMRFVYHRAYFLEKSYTVRYHHLTSLKALLSDKANEKAQEWAASLEGDTRTKMATITGYSETTIQMIEFIGNNNISAYEAIEKGEISLRNECNKLKGKKNNPIEKPDAQGQHEKKRMLERMIEDFEFSCKEGHLKVMYKGQEVLNELQIENPDGKKDNLLRYDILTHDKKGGIMITFDNPEYVIECIENERNEAA